MKKKLLSTILAVAMTMTALVGCGETKAPAASNDSAESTEASSEAAEVTETAEPVEDVEISFYTTETGKDQMFQDILP